jgi:hypothetical protein
LSQFWSISSVPRYSTVPYVNGSTVTNRFICGFIDKHNWQANPPHLIRLLEIDQAQYEACAGEMIASGQDRGFTCWDP